MYQEQLITAIEASLKAGKEILEIYEREDFEIQIKKDKSPLTYADRKSNQTIEHLLKNTGIPILSEEGKLINYEIRKQWKTFWLIDPLDGTKEFIKRNGEFTVNIALVHQKTPILGVIYVPVLNALYFATLELGAYKISDIDHQSLNENPTIDTLMKRAHELPFQPSNAEFTVVGSRSHLSEETKNFTEKLQSKFGDIKIISSGSSLKICLVAEGKANIYPRFSPTMEWDTGAGHAIALAAGCEIKEADGVTDLKYNKENLTNPWFMVKPEDMDVSDIT